MELAPVGDVSPDQIDLDPIIVPVVAWRLKDKKKMIEKFSFQPTMSFGASLGMYEDVDADGNPRPGTIVRWLMKCVMPDDLQRWRDFLASDEIAIEQQTVLDVYSQLAELYSARPTMRRTGSSGTPGSTKRTSPAVARSRASASKKSRSPAR